MSKGLIAVGILLFACATAILYVWGLQKSMHQGEDLTRKLIAACRSRILKYLKAHDTISKDEIASLIEGIKIGQFWSKNRLTIQNGKKVAPQVIEFMLDQQYIEEFEKNQFRLIK